MCRVSRVKGDVGHGSLAARRAICRRGSTLQAGDWCCVLVDGSTLLLGRHAGLRRSSYAGFCVHGLWLLWLFVLVGLLGIGIVLVDG